MYDNWAVTAGGVLAARFFILYRYPSFPNYPAWALSSLPVLTVSYAWLRVEHPDQATKVRRAVVSAVRFVVDIVKSIARFTTRLGDGGPIDDERMATWREVRSERENRSHERRTDPKKSATLRIEQDVWSSWGCPGAVLDYHRDDVEGTRTWVVALPDDMVAQQAVRILRDRISRGADVPSNQIAVTEGGNSGRVVVLVRREAMRVLPDLIKHPVTTAAVGARSVLQGARVGATYDGEWIVPLATEKGANHLFIGGAPNQGKSALITNVLAEAAAMVDAQVWLADPKRVDYAAWRNVVARYANTVEAIEALVRDLGAEMERRYELLEGQGGRKWRATPETPQIVFILDEAADLSKDGQLRLKEISRLCRAAGITVVIATQRPTKENINTSLLAQLVERVALHCATAAEMSYVLGEWSPDELGGDRPNDDFLRRPGDALIKSQSKGWHLGRSYYLSDDEIGGLIGRLSGRPSSQEGVDRGTPPLVENADHMGGVEDDEGDGGDPAVIPPAVLFERPVRQMQIWIAVASINFGEQRPATKVETAQRLELAPRTIADDLNALVSEGLLRWAHESGGGKRTGLLAMEPQ